MTTDQLCQRYAELFGKPTRSRHRMYLVRKIAWKLQAFAEGDLSERAQRRAEKLARGVELQVMPPKTPTSVPLAVNASASEPRDPRLPTSCTVIVRCYKGRTLQMTVLRDGFAFEDQRYRSLSAVAKGISGSHCTSCRFFGLEGEE